MRETWISKSVRCQIGFVCLFITTIPLSANIQEKELLRKIKPRYKSELLKVKIVKHYFDTPFYSCGIFCSHCFPDPSLFLLDWCVHDKHILLVYCTALLPGTGGANNLISL